MVANETQPRTTPVDGYDVIEQPPGTFMVMSDEGPIEETFETFAAAYKFIQKIATDHDRGSGGSVR